MSRPAAVMWDIAFPNLALFHDPIPGEPTVVSAYAERYKALSEQIFVTATKVRAIGEAIEFMPFTGDNDALFVQILASSALKVASDLKRTQDRYKYAASALAQYSLVLESAQVDSMTAYQQAGMAQGRLLDGRYWVARVDATQVIGGEAEESDLRRTHRQAELEILTAESDVVAADNLLKSAIAMRDDGARAAIKDFAHHDDTGHLPDSRIGTWIRDNASKINRVLAADQALAIGMAVADPEGMAAIEAIVGISDMLDVASVSAVTAEIAAGAITPSAATWQIAQVILPRTFHEGSDMRTLSGAALADIDTVRSDPTELDRLRAIVAQIHSDNDPKIVALVPIGVSFAGVEKAMGVEKEMGVEIAISKETMPEGHDASPDLHKSTVSSVYVAYKTYDPADFVRSLDPMDHTGG